MPLYLVQYAHVQLMYACLECFAGNFGSNRFARLRTRIFMTDFYFAELNTTVVPDFVQVYTIFE